MPDAVFFRRLIKSLGTNHGQCYKFEVSRHKFILNTNSPQTKGGKWRNLRENYLRLGNTEYFGNPKCCALLAFKLGTINFLAP